MGDFQQEYEPWLFKSDPRDAEIARLTAEIQEMKAEQELFDQDLAENQRLIDRIADLVGLPHDCELDQTKFEMWFDRMTAERDDLQDRLGQAEVRIETDGRELVLIRAERDRLRTVLKPFAEVVSTWDGEDASLVIQLLAYDEGPAPCVNVEDFREAARVYEQSGDKT